MHRHVLGLATHGGPYTSTVRPRHLGALAVVVALIGAALVVPDGWGVVALSSVAGLTIGLVCWDVWRSRRAGREDG